MIHLAVARVVEELNRYLELRAPTLTPPRAVADSLFDIEGKPKVAAAEKVVVSLVNVEQDRVYRSIDPFERPSEGATTAHFVRPEININLYLLFIANLSDYDEAMKAVTYVISFFQRGSIFPISDPDWDSDQEVRMSLELFTLSFEQQNHLWGTLGSKFMPSVLYKAGLLKVRDTQVEADVGLVEEILVNE